MVLAFIEAKIINNRNFEIFAAICLCVMLAYSLINFWPVNVWRLDSMYYLHSYAGKLSEEGRWINYFLFDFLRVMPGQMAVWLCYLGIAYFGYRIAKDYTDKHIFSLIFGLLLCQIPIIPAQLQWPETLMPAFILLGLSPVIARLMPFYIFFPLMAVLFFGTFSAFYFLLPLIFLKGINAKRAGYIFLIWVLSFGIGYLLTNAVVWQLTGEPIRIASWRNPRYVTDITSLFENLKQVFMVMSSQFTRIGEALINPLIFLIAGFGAYSAVVLRAHWILLMGVVCAFGVYFSTLPVGIYIQERTLIPVFVGLIAAFFLRQYSNRKMVAIAVGLMLILGMRMSVLSNNLISWYRTNIDNMQTEFARLLPYEPDTVQRLFVVANFDEAQPIFARFNQVNGLRGRFSEGLVYPQYWLPVLTQMGFKNFRICSEMEGGDCAYIKPHYEDRSLYSRVDGRFVAWKINENDVILTTNPNYLKSTQSVPIPPQPY